MARRDDLEDDGMRVAPVLVVEVRSPSTGLYDRTAKAASYAEFGVPQLWLLDPDASELAVLDLVPGSPGQQPGHVVTARHDVPDPVPVDWPPVIAAVAAHR